MSGVLVRMERDGLVRRFKSNEDQRRMFVALTDAGQQRFVEMADDMELNYQRLVSRLGEDKLALLTELLDELKAIEP